MELAYLNLLFEQINSGKNLTLTDSTPWGIDIGVELTDITNVTVIAEFETEIVEVINEDFISPAQEELAWEITKDDFVGSIIDFTNDTFPDGIWKFTYRVTADGTTYTKDFYQLLLYNVEEKIALFTVNLSYSFVNSNAVYDKNVQKAQLYDTLLTAIRYQAQTGQLLRITDTLTTLQNLLK
jgi:hypothetical protein